MEGKCTLYTKIICKGVLLVYKFTVYSLTRPPYNHFHEIDEEFLAFSLGQLNELVCDHQLDDIMIEIIIQNDVIASSQFIGDRWGI